MSLQAIINDQQREVLHQLVASLEEQQRTVQECVDCGMNFGPLLERATLQFKLASNLLAASEGRPLPYPNGG